MKAFTLADYEAALSALAPPRRAASYVPHAPHPRQAEFLALDSLEALYGGAAGGGKSDALLMAALQYVDVPGYSALLLRRTFADLALPGAIMDRAKAWLAGSPAVWNEQSKTFTFPSGARLSFGYLDVEKDRFRYQGAEFQFIGFDELTQFPEQWYRYLASRLRKLEGSPVPLRLRGATNPGGIGHEWVRRRFVDGEAAFVPAKLVDNPSVDAESYRASLALLDGTTRRQLEDGLWQRDTGGLVFAFDPSRNVAHAPPKLSRYVLGIDYGYTDACAFVELGWAAGDRRVFVTRVHRAEKMTPSTAAEFVRGWMATRDYDRIVGDAGGLGKGYVEEARERFGLPIEAAQKVNKRAYLSLFNGALEGGLLLVGAGCGDLVEEWAELPWNADRSDYEPGFLDHLSDACLYAWREASAWAEDLPSEAPHETLEAKLARDEAELEREVEEARTSRRRNAWASRMAGR